LAKQRRETGTGGIPYLGDWPTSLSAGTFFIQGAKQPPVHRADSVAAAEGDDMKFVQSVVIILASMLVVYLIVLIG